MAWPPYQSPARAKPEASDLLIGNPSGHRSTPLSAGRLRMPLLSDFMVHRARAVGKCQYQVTYSCAIGMLRETLPTWAFSCTLGKPELLMWKEAIFSAGSARFYG